MDGKFGLFDIFAKRMGWLSQRQSLLAQNIANSDTPGYVARDMAPGSFQRALRADTAGMRPVRTSEGHIADVRVERYRHREQREMYETAPVGNAVVIEEQLVKVSETQLNHNTITNLYNKYQRMFRTALGSTGR